MPDEKCRILYVDDHDDSAEMLKLVLADGNYEVESARTVDQALEMALKVEFDLYVVDKRLPDGSGLELLKQLNKLTPGIPSIVYTGDVYEVHREQAMAAGAHAFVCKPDIETLIKTVHEFLSERECATATAA
jgi:two-component system response regulator PilR (NtrC family)